MMLYPAMSKLSEHVPNRYLLVNVVARRARQLSLAAECSGEPMNAKPVTLAINEVAEGKFDVSTIDTSISTKAFVE